MDALERLQRSSQQQSKKLSLEEQLAEEEKMENDSNQSNPLFEDMSDEASIKFQSSLNAISEVVYSKEQEEETEEIVDDEPIVEPIKEETIEPEQLNTNEAKDEPKNEHKVEENLVQEGLFNYNNVVTEKPKRGRPAKRDTIKKEIVKSEKPVEEKPQVQLNTSSNPYDSIINALAVRVIDDLIESNYSIKGFDKQQSLLILNYIKEKVKS